MLHVSVPRPSYGIKISDFVHIDATYFSEMKLTKTEEPPFVKCWQELNVCTNAALKTLQISNEHGIETQAVQILGAS